MVGELAMKQRTSREVDTIEHRFSDCHITTIFWTSLETWGNANHRGPDIYITKQMMLFGHFELGQYALNNLLLNARHFIHKQVCQKLIPNFNHFRMYFAYKVSLEIDILKRKNIKIS